MTPRKKIDPAELRAALLEVRDWLADADAPAPSRAQLAAAVRLSARTLENTAPGSSVEVRVPPFVAVQCVAGPRHTRGTPPNVVETDPRTWLLLVTGTLTFDAASAAGTLTASGTRAREIEHWLPLLRV
ncbi:sterol carrier family protein [Rhodococcus daqingensis]|uniref:Sterol carrier family protein n=1 Tax=Rhodococcus daqingensis TaxID=2479363 RepID=A0ABW2RVK7_9NOCA